MRVKKFKARLAHSGRECELVKTTPLKNCGTLEDPNASFEGLPSFHLDSGETVNQRDGRYFVVQTEEEIILT